MAQKDWGPYSAFIHNTRDANINVSFPLNEDNEDKTALLTVYRGVPVGQSEDDFIDDGHRFVRVLPNNAVFISKDDCSHRCDEQRLVADFNKLSEKKKVTVDSWKPDGEYKEQNEPPFVAKFPERRSNRDAMSSEEWTEKQKKQWSKLLLDAEKIPSGYNVLSRFIEPSMPDDFEIIFTPSEASHSVSHDQLKAYVEELQGQLQDTAPSQDYQIRVLPWDDAKKDGALRLLGSSFLGLYHTWISKDNYKALWKVAEKEPLARPWPKDREVAEKINKTLSNEAKDPDDLTTQSAWLHRSAFRFGGLGANADIWSSQTRENLVFGTSECNTNMIRAEDAISDLVNADEKTVGNLIMTNMITGNIVRPREDWTETDEAIPGWVEEARKKGGLLWLCFQLKYQFTFDSKKLNLNLNNTELYDPFSRYVPLRFEARLDELVLKHVISEAELRTTNATAQPGGPTTTTIGPPGVLNMAVASSATRVKRATVLHHTAVRSWRHVISGSQTITVNGVHVQSAKVVSHPDGQAAEPLNLLTAFAAGDASSRALASTFSRATLASVAPPPEGFTLEGEIDLFNSGIKAHFSSYSGPAPGNAVLPVGVAPAYDQATVNDDFRLSPVVPVLKGTPFDSITLTNVTFTYQNCYFDSSKALGWHIDADLPIDPSTGVLYEALRTVLNVQEPTVHLHAGLGLNQNFSRPLSIASFTLDGSFTGVQVKICDGFTLMQIGLELLGLQRIESFPVPRTLIDYGFGIFGQFNIDVPGSTIPLQLSYKFIEVGGVLQLHADLDGEIWRDPLGVQGLTLFEVTFTADVLLSAPMQSGSYAAGGQFSLSAVMTHFDLFMVCDIFEALTGAELARPDIDIKFGSASLIVASGTGLTISVTDVQVNGHVAASALLSIGPNGVLIRGEVMSSGSIHLGEVELRKAYIEINLKKGSAGSGVLLGGEIAFESFLLDALVHLYKGTNGIEWTAIASLATSGDALALSKLVPELSDTFLDLALTKAVFVAASADDPMVCAVLSPIDALDSLMRSSAPTTGLTLSAGWSDVTGFSLDVIMPATSVLDLGNGIVTDPFTLRIQGGASPSLMLIAGVQIPVTPDGDHLDFKLSLAANAFNASAAVQMNGFWTNPVGLGENIRIGPDVALSIDIVYAQFLTTGTPSGFGIVGGLGIGKTSASIVMQISDNPSRELISGQVQSLDINDVVSFANLITGLDIPQPPKFVDFEDVELYICPAGTTIGTIIYPQGFSFQAAMVLFEKHTEIACSVGPGGLIVKGGIDNFTLGPLSIHGLDQPRATIDIEVGATLATRQHILIDGVISFLGAEEAVSIQVDVLPDPAFKFYISLKFTDLLLFTLDAELVGAISFNGLENADFVFYALLEQDIIAYIEDQLDLQFEAARQASEDGFDKAERDLKDAEDAVNAHIEEAQTQLNSAESTWDAKRIQVTTSSNSVIGAYLKKIEELEGNIADAQHTYDQAMSDAEAKLQQANNDRAAKLQDAQDELEQAKRDTQAAIDDAQRDVTNAQNRMNSDFGNAQRSIDEAKGRVDSLQGQINDCNNEINRLKNLPWYNPERAKITYEGVKLGGLLIAKGTADGVLDVAKAILTSTNYLAEQGALRAAQSVLQGAKNALPVTISAAQGVLSGVDKATWATVIAAQATVSATRTGIEYIVLEGAKQTLVLYKQANEGVYHAAIAALDALWQSAEYFAFQVASGVLDAAKEATTSLDALRGALGVAQKAEDIALKIGQWIADHALGLIDIRKIELSGSVRGMVDSSGGIGKPLSAHVEYIIASKSGKFDGELDVRNTADFIKATFQHLWEEVKALV
ncbi:hypothetical protein DFH07DRAFT_980740 [Mycena maculata]|uniref:Uncharacterized protein n=1 Tax=Mycena maculata TaxID=230809 RepID=A0AAD7NUH8_9AGAR|nr:hypothetical protein DFH07DRAFT_980740 [Mycena maculata]